jgi:hypothetical protein
MARPAAQREIVCYHCRAVVGVAMAARSSTCPRCYRRLLLDDLVVSSPGLGATLSTCGIVRIQKRVRAAARAIHAGDGVEVLGSLEASVVSDGPVVVARGASLRGEVQATGITVEPGGSMDAARVCIRPRGAAMTAGSGTPAG